MKFKISDTFSIKMKSQKSQNKDARQLGRSIWNMMWRLMFWDLEVEVSHGSHRLLLNMGSVLAWFALVFASRSTHALRRGLDFQDAGTCLQVAKQRLGKVTDVASHRQ